LWSPRSSSLGSLVTLLAVVIAFIYLTLAFWLKENTFKEQPWVSPTQQFVIQIHGSQGAAPLALTWSSNTIYNQWMNDFSRGMTVKVNSKKLNSKSWTQDLNHDGLADALDFEIIIPLLDSEYIFNVRAAFELQYEISV
jgi:transmembrane protein 231